MILCVKELKQKLHFSSPNLSTPPPLPPNHHALSYTQCKTMVAYVEFSSQGTYNLVHFMNTSPHVKISKRYINYEPGRVFLSKKWTVKSRACQDPTWLPTWWKVRVLKTTFSSVAKLVRIFCALWVSLRRLQERGRNYPILILCITVPQESISSSYIFSLAMIQ